MNFKNVKVINKKRAHHLMRPIFNSLNVKQLPVRHDGIDFNGITI